MNKAQMDAQTLDVVDGRALVAAPAHLVRLTHIMYAMHSVGLCIGAFTAATIVGAFVFCWPSIIAIVMNYVKRDEVAGTILASHFAWQATTFWRCAVALFICFALYLILVGFFINWILFGLVGLWAVYRIARGWMALSALRPVS